LFFRKNIFGHTGFEQNFVLVSSKDWDQCHQRRPTPVASLFRLPHKCKDCVVGIFVAKQLQLIMWVKETRISADYQIVSDCAGADPTTYEFTAATPALNVVG
jgi:hypothetical protein